MTSNDRPHRHDSSDDSPPSLIWERIECLPIVHGRLAFAIEARRRLLDDEYSAVAVELPPSLQSAWDRALDDLPRVSVIAYQQRPRFLDESQAVFYVPVQPGDAIVEASRVARGERLPLHLVDAETDEYHGVSITLPDPQLIAGLGVEPYYHCCLPIVRRQLRRDQDDLRESHMAARLLQIMRSTPDDRPILFVCGMAHWEGIRQHLEQKTGELQDGDPIPEELTAVHVAHPRSVPHVMGDLPYLVGQYELYRSGFNLDPYDPTPPFKRLFLAARRVLKREDSGTLERPDPPRLRAVLDFLRKLVVRRGQLFPDSYSLTVATKGVVGNDFALICLELANLYPYNGPDADPERLFLTGGADWDDLVEAAYLEQQEGDPFAGVSPSFSFGSSDSDGPAALDSPDGLGGSDDLDSSDELEGPEVDGEGFDRLRFGFDRVALDGTEVPFLARYPGTAFTVGPLSLERRPDLRQRHEYREQWDERVQCSWPPEDLVIESFRDYIGKRALSLARVGMTRSEPFTTSFLDGVDLRATLRDVCERKIHVREEPRVPGAVGALVMIFEEDDFGERFPWRATWMAEHAEESTLAFYATQFADNVIGPGIARAFYGGCLLVFPPVPFPDIWHDMRFEQARTPSERLLLAAIYWSPDYFVAHVSAKPPRAAVKEEASRLGKHILHLPLSTFSPTTLERLRRFHVLNGQEVRTWAQRFIR